MRRYSVAVIGGGAAGMTAAISAARKGSSVVMCERLPVLGKKVLASGNGRCNLSNDLIDDSFYNFASQPLVKNIFSRFGKTDIYNFFKSIRVRTYSEDGRIFPVTNQSATVLRALELELKKRSVHTELNFKATDISGSRGSFVIRSESEKKIEADTVVLAGGGRSYPALGSDGSCYKLASVLGHEIIDPVPAAVSLVVKDPLCHALQGQKIIARARPVLKGRALAQASGDLLFTKYGLSGTCILDISDEVSIAINRNRSNDVAVSVDLVPFMSAQELEADISDRINNKRCGEDLLVGILPNKFGRALERITRTRDLFKIVSGLKDMTFDVSGTRGWNECEFTAGGVDTAELDQKTLQSVLKPGLYFAGEVLDVNGKRGGYNLAWAWASGYMAGLGE